MNLKFGFELEGFYFDDRTGKVSLPPKTYPTDGFPGLCEVRSTGGKSLEDAYFEVFKEFSKTPFNYDRYEAIFTPEQKRQLRRLDSRKEAVVLSNIYGKSPKALGNKTIASFQISISNLTHHEYYDDKGVRQPARYGLFDYVPIIRALDAVFAKEIKDSNRQPGWYAIKDGTRVEYRSLPSSVFTEDTFEIQKLLGKINRAIKDT